MSAARLVCPWCRITLPEGATHCTRCGLRVASLDRPPVARADRRALTPRALAVRGAVAGAGLAALSLVAGGVTGLLGGDARAVAGDAAFICAAVAVLVAVLLGGVRVSRWGEYDQLRQRARGDDAHAALRVRVAVALAAVGPLVVVAALSLTQR